MRQYKIIPISEYWIIARHTTKIYEDPFDEDPREVRFKVEYALIEFDNVYDLDEYCSDASVTAGESVGREEFKILAMSHEWDDIARALKEADKK